MLTDGQSVVVGLLSAIVVVAITLHLLFLYSISKSLEDIAFWHWKQQDDEEDEGV